MISINELQKQLSDYLKFPDNASIFNLAVTLDNLDTLPLIRILVDIQSQLSEEIIDRPKETIL